MLGKTPMEVIGTSVVKELAEELVTLLDTQGMWGHIGACSGSHTVPGNDRLNTLSRRMAHTEIIVCFLVLLSV